MHRSYYTSYRITSTEWGGRTHKTPRSHNIGNSVRHTKAYAWAYGTTFKRTRRSRKLHITSRCHKRRNLGTHKITDIPAFVEIPVVYYFGIVFTITSMQIGLYGSVTRGAESARNGETLSTLPTASAAATCDRVYNGL